MPAHPTTPGNRDQGGMRTGGVWKEQVGLQWGAFPAGILHSRHIPIVGRRHLVGPPVHASSLHDHVDLIAVLQNPDIL
jgi:hypothetical protein